MSALVSTVVAALSAFAALASLFLYLYFGRRSDLAQVREEALALAQTRGQVIRELRGQLGSLEERHKRAKADRGRRIRDLRAELDKTRSQAREDAYRTQHFYASSLADLLNDLRSDLERTPPDVDAALTRIRKLLALRSPVS
jgi:molybdopterin converting factor small subunit